MIANWSTSFPVPAVAERRFELKWMMGSTSPGGWWVPNPLLLHKYSEGAQFEHNIRAGYKIKRMVKT